MVLLKATLLLSSLVPASALSLVPAIHLEQPPANSTNESLQLLGSITQSGSPTNATASLSYIRPIVSIRCYEELGRDLKFSSCDDAFHNLHLKPGRQTWGWRGAGTFSRILPRSTISSMCPKMRFCSRMKFEYL